MQAQCIRSNLRCHKEFSRFKFPLLLTFCSKSEATEAGNAPRAGPLDQMETGTSGVELLSCHPAALLLLGHLSVYLSMIITILVLRESLESLDLSD